jgi:hypothetical protein
VPQKILDINSRIAKSAFEGITINLVMEWEYNATAIGMLHLHMAPLAVNLHKPHPLQGGYDLAARKKRQLHSVRAITSWESSWSNS